MLAGRLERCRRAHSHAHGRPRTWKGQGLHWNCLLFSLMSLTWRLLFLSQPVYYSRTFSGLSKPPPKKVCQSAMRTNQSSKPTSEIKKRSDLTWKRLGCCSELFFISFSLKLLPLAWDCSDATTHLQGSQRIAPAGQLPPSPPPLMTRSEWADWFGKRQEGISDPDNLWLQPGYAEKRVSHRSAARCTQQSGRRASASCCVWLMTVNGSSTLFSPRVFPQLSCLPTPPPCIRVHTSWFPSVNPFFSHLGPD